MRENIGFKGYTGIVYMFVMLAACAGVGVWLICLWATAEEPNEVYLPLGVILAAVGLACGVLGVIRCFRPAVLVQLDEKNVYLWQRKGTVAVSLRAVSKVEAGEAYRSLSRSGSVTVTLNSGAKVSVSGLSDPLDVRIRIERAAEAARAAAENPPNPRRSPSTTPGRPQKRRALFGCG